MGHSNPPGYILCPELYLQGGLNPDDWIDQEILLDEINDA